MYGYVPFLILPLFAALDRIDQRQIEAARDLGASPFERLPPRHAAALDAGLLAGIVLIALPMFGDYYTPDLLSASPKTAMIGNQIDQLTRQGSEKVVGAVLTILLALCAARADALLPPRDAPRRPEGGGVSWLRNPWGKPRFLPLVSALYIMWSLIPVAIAILFAFNDGRSRTTLAGVLAALVHRGETGSVLHDPALQGALKHTLFLAVLCVSVATPIGVALALGLQRWRGRGSGTANTLMLLPLVTPEIVMGVALLLLFLQVLPRHRARHDRAGDRAGDVHALLRRRDRARAARLDRARTTRRRRPTSARRRTTSCFRVLAAAARARDPRQRRGRASRSRSTTSSSPSTSSSDADTTTVSMLLYASARGAPTPALNALATVTLADHARITLALAYFVYRTFAGGEDAAAVATLEV